MNHVHPTAIIGAGVELGDNNTIGPYVVLAGPLRIGSGNWIGASCVIGGPAEFHDFEHSTTWPDEPSPGPGIVIGDNNVIRELSAVTQGSHRATTIGNHCFFMGKVHIPHDAVLCDHTTISPMAALGGHVQVGEGANLGIGTSIHQGRIIGAGAMIGMGAVVVKDIPPFAKAYGSPCRVSGANVVYMMRHGFDEEVVQTLQRWYEEHGYELPEDLNLPREIIAHFEWWTAARAQTY
ncbi:MAG: hypothetical protein LBR21_09655 [Propionibacteriaceae bacterium]|nr:hypothetical protein [Propionibacteriaceae bacterium]